MAAADEPKVIILPTLYCRLISRVMVLVLSQSGSDSSTDSDSDDDLPTGIKCRAYF
jgi:hypothetical protein